MAIAGRGNLKLGLMAAALVLAWPAMSSAYTPEEQQACSGDAFRLCSAEIPDVDRITACMIARKQQLSPGCRAFFRDGPEREAEVTGRTEGKPMARKKARPHRTKKPAKSDD